MASIVLPHPAAPQTSVARPAGSPPPVISSSPSIPVEDLFRIAALGIGSFFI